MVFTAHRARTTFAILAAGAAVAGGLLLRQQGPCEQELATATTQSPYIDARFGTELLAPDQLDQDIAVTLTMPAVQQKRPKLSLAVVIDRSGSMAGAPMDNAKAAAAELVDQLQDGDTFTVVTYSSSAETVMPLRAATASSKRAARAAIEMIEADGGTCISCGIQIGETNLEGAPNDIDSRRIRVGVRRMVLISDGQANEGLWDRDELAQLTAATAAHGISLSAVGVGLDFDEVTMIRLAEVGRGHYYFVEDTQKLAAMFVTELGSLADTVATDVRLTIHPVPGTTITSAYGYPLTRDANGDVVIPVADMGAGETRKVVVHAQLGRVDRGALGAGDFALDWRIPASTEHQHAQVFLMAKVSADARAIAASRNVDAQSAIAEARAANVLEDAAITYDHYGQAAAQKVIERHMVELREQNVAPAAMQRIEGAANAAIDGFAQPPEKARKVTRTHAYELAR